MLASKVADHAPVFIRLLQGVIYSDDISLWNLLLKHQLLLREELARLGLELVLSESDGYAFLKQSELEDAEGAKVALPRLMRRDRLTFAVTLLCVLLRERLDGFESSIPESDRLILSQDELYELQRPYFPDQNDERTLYKKLNETVNKVEELGFLKRISGTEIRYEVRRVIKARVDSERLAEIKAKLHTAKGATEELHGEQGQGEESI